MAASSDDKRCAAAGMALVSVRVIRVFIFIFGTKKQCARLLW